MTIKTDFYGRPNKEALHLYVQTSLPNSLVGGKRICKEAEGMLN